MSLVRANPVEEAPHIVRADPSSVRRAAPRGAHAGAGHPLWLLLLANAAVLLGICSSYIPREAFHELRSAVWALAVWLTYPWLYLLPAYAVAALAGALASRAFRHRAGVATAVSLSLACVLFGGVQLAAVADQRLVTLYGFHLNGFVWNLLTTPGGIAALGAGPETFVAFAAVAAGILVAEVAVALAVLRAARESRFAQRLVSRRFATSVLLSLVALTGFERVSFGASRVDGYTSVLAAEEAFPFYMRTSFNHLAAQLGFHVVRSGAPLTDLKGAGLAYPLHPIAFEPEAPRLNVVVLCAESLRADVLNPENMPATWAFAEHALRFEHHVSAGNGTRMGVFGLFYGLPGPYWFRFLSARREPALLGALRERGYDLRAFTADDFSYPELAQTVFAGLDPSERIETGSHAPSWQRDRAMVGRIDDFLERRDPARPFFMYAFFESPHARYDFPPETAVYRPYLESFDYVTMDLERDIEAIHNRYRNAVRHLDTQLDHVLATLRARDLLGSTLVVITGDHGEEFMEQGRWGHNSAFSEPQIRVPLVLHVPGRDAGVSDRFTSHLDLPATLLDALGTSSPPGDYSLGQSLLGDVERRYALVSDWAHVAYVDREGKVVFPTRGSGFSGREVRDRSDVPLADPDRYLGERSAQLAAVWSEISRFSVRR